MATQWMDDFQGYGTVGANLVNGPYVEIQWLGLQADPDPTAGGKNVLYISANSSSVIRRVLTTGETTVGVALRLWLTNLPPGTNSVPIICEFTDINNNSHGYIAVNPSGYVVAYRTDNGGPTQIGISANPVVLTNAWQHIECKYVLDNAVGSVEVRIAGIQVLLVTGVKTTSGVSGAGVTCLNVRHRNYASGSTTGCPTMYLKDYIIWDGTGAVNNTFFGSCQVYRLIPAADVARNWNTTIGAAPIQSTPTTSTTGGTLVAGTYYYVVTAILNPQGESIASNEQSIVTTGTTSSNTITWTAPVGMTVTGYKVYRGTGAGLENVFYSPGNVLTYTDTNAASTGGTPPTDTGTGYNKINESSPDDDATFITAGQSPYPAAYQATLTQLPNNVTSVRSVMPIHRSRKTDGGDGNIQTSLISGANTGAGSNRPITTAYTYWWDIFETDPSGSNWNKTLVNALKLKLDRTL